MLRALTNKVFIQAVNDPDVSEGGLIIPDIAKERSRQGIVQYVGPDVEGLKPGDYVIFSPYSGETIQVKDEGTFVVMPEEAIIGVIRMQNIPLDLYVADKVGEFHKINYEYLMQYLAEVFRQSTLARGLSSINKEKRSAADRKEALK